MKAASKDARLGWFLSIACLSSFSIRICWEGTLVCSLIWIEMMKLRQKVILLPMASAHWHVHIELRGWVCYVLIPPWECFLFHAHRPDRQDFGQGKESDKLLHGTLPIRMLQYQQHLDRSLLGFWEWSLTPGYTSWSPQATGLHFIWAKCKAIVWKVRMADRAGREQVAGLVQ